MITKAIVLTTINPPVEAVLQFAQKKGFSLFISGDMKSPAEWNAENVTYLSYNQQEKKYAAFSQAVAKNHYARKNLAYLEAINSGVSYLYETDDDNYPNAYFPNFIEQPQTVEEITGDSSFNIFSLFTKKHIWPRGLPLSAIASPIKKTRVTTIIPLIQQSLIDLDPDVDAIYRLTIGKMMRFKKGKIVTLAKGTFAPFNTQSTYWHKKAFPLLYLPSTVTSRTTDIWRGYIAQRILWELDSQMLFLSPCVYQKRNVHNFMDDFRQELDVYTRVDDLLSELANIQISGTIPHMMVTIYNHLIKRSFFEAKELEALQLWLRYFPA